MSNNQQSKNKPKKRIEKELLLLRNLPKDYKLGKRDTDLGTLLYVKMLKILEIQLEIDKSAINSNLVDKMIEKFNFDILLREKYPF